MNNSTLSVRLASFLLGHQRQWAGASPSFDECVCFASIGMNDLVEKARGERNGGNLSEGSEDMMMMVTRRVERVTKRGHTLCLQRACSVQPTLACSVSHSEKHDVANAATLSEHEQISGKLEPSRRLRWQSPRQQHLASLHKQAASALYHSRILDRLDGFGSCIPCKACSLRTKASTCFTAIGELDRIEGHDVRWRIRVWPNFELESP